MKYLDFFILTNLINDSTMNEGDIRDIKNLLAADFKPIYLLLFLIAVFFIFLFFFLRKKTETAVKKEIQVLPPDMEALERIRKLKELKLVEQGRYKEFYTMISDIIRKFIEGWYKIPALDRTTFELISELKERNVLSGRVTIVQEFLMNCDMVKFAKYAPRAEDAGSIIRTAEEIISIAKNDPPGGTRESMPNV